MVGILEIGSLLAVGIMQLLIGLMLALVAAYAGLKLFDWMTKGIEEVKELKKGNAAVGILMGAVILSFANIVQGGVAALSASIIPGMSTGAIVVAFAVGIINLFMGLIVAVIAIYIAIFVLDRITVDIDEWKEIEKGNVAIAVLIASVLLAVSFVVRSEVASISQVLDVHVIAKLLGL